MPTLPRLHHTIHDYPMDERRDEEALLGSNPTGPGYDQLRASSRVLPEPPKPALIVDNGRHVFRSFVGTGSAHGINGPKMPKPSLSPAASPARPVPKTPPRSTVRQQSTDSVLTEILRSTEKRLREGQVSGTLNSNRLSSPPTKIPRRRESGGPVFQCRTPSPKKNGPSQPTTPGHERQDSHQSASSEADSLAGEEPHVPDASSDLTSPSRNRKKQEPERQPAEVQSVRSSVSSELSTLYSEDEMPEEVRKAIMPLDGLVVQRQQAAKVGPPTMNDPFVAAPLSPSVPRESMGHGWPKKQHKGQDLFRESLERSQRLRGMIPSARSQGLILAPGPAVCIAGPRSLPVSPPARQVSTTIPSSIQPYLGCASRASEPPTSPTRQSDAAQGPNGSLLLRLTRTSTLSTIPPLPPPEVPGLALLKEQRRKILPSIAAALQAAGDQPQMRRLSTLMLPPRERSSWSGGMRRSSTLALPSTTGSRASGALPGSSTLMPPSTEGSNCQAGETRLSIVLTPKHKPQQQRQQNRTSAPLPIREGLKSTTAATAKTAAGLNRENFRANSLIVTSSSLYPAPLSLGRTSSPSKLSVELTAHGDKEGKGGNGDDGHGEDEDIPLAITHLIASLRRINSGTSTVHSLRSIPDRSSTPTPNPTPTRTPDAGRRASIAVGVTAAAPSAAAGGASGSSSAGNSSNNNVNKPRDGVAEQLRQQQHRKSVGARNYLSLGSSGNGGRQARLASRAAGRVTRSPAGGGGGGSRSRGSGSRNASSVAVAGSSPYKRRRPGSTYEAGKVVRRVSFADVGEEEEGKENNGEGGLKIPAGEFTFGVGGSVLDGKSGTAWGLREGSGGNALMVQQLDQQPQALSLAWKAVNKGNGSGTGSPVRSSDSPSGGSAKSVDSLGLYDRQGFLISTSPVRGASPALRV
ncbi:hypothetical protein VTK56DRAFT_9466 [Thermocarpiscus australiensis]